MNRYELPTDGWQLHVDEVGEGRCTACHAPAVVWVSFTRITDPEVSMSIGRHYRSGCFAKIRIDWVAEREANKAALAALARHSRSNLSG